MKWICGLLAAVATLVGADCCGNMYGAGVDALYWLPMHCPIDWAHRRNDPIPTRPPSDAFSLNPQIDWGFRVYGWMACGKTYGGASYLWYRSDKHHNVRLSAANLAPNNFAIGENFFAGSASLRNDYQNADVRIGHLLKCSECGWLGAFINVRWADLEQRHRMSFTDVEAGGTTGVGALTFRPEYWGVGPGAGLEGRVGLWECCGNVGLFGKINLMGLVGRREVKTRNSVITALADGAENPIQFNWKPDTTISLAGDFSIGLDYLWSCDCWWLGLRVGYEINYLWEVLYTESITLVRNQLANPPENVEFDYYQRGCINIGFGGPFFGITAGF